MTPKSTPLYLFADSQLLFWSHEGAPFLRSALQSLSTPEPSAAYIGASNGDSPGAYAIFSEAMRVLGIQRFQMIRSSFPTEDQAFLQQADLIVLAGGEVERGWKTFVETGMKERILERHAQGALVIGVSAGAMQLGRYGLVEKSGASAELIDAFQQVPFVISAHDERRNWETLRQTIQLMEGAVSGIGIPSGGGLIYHPDQTIEAVRHPLQEFTVRDGKVTGSLIFPPE